MSKPKVLVTFSSAPKIVFDILSPSCEVICCKMDPADRSEIISQVSGVNGILIFWSPTLVIDKEFLDIAGPNLKVISTMSIGADHIDVKEVKSRGILIGNTKSVLSNGVADMAVLLTLAATRRLNENLEAAKSGLWKETGTNRLGLDLQGSTVGLVGLGSIGQQIVKRLKPFEVAQFLYCGHQEKPQGKELDAKFVTFNTLLQESDIIIIACPCTSETKDMFNEITFKKMKKTAVLVNISRGGIVNQDALVKALEEKTIFAAALDVTNPEPLPSDHKLFQLPNCVITPHIGSTTVKCRNEIAEMAARNILAAFNNEPLLSSL